MKQILSLTLFLLLPLVSMAQNTTDDGDYYFYLTKAKRALAARDTLQAIRMYEEVTKIAPTFADAHERLGRLYEWRRDANSLRTAVKHFEQYVSLSTDEAKKAEVQQRIEQLQTRIALVQDDPQEDEAPVAAVPVTPTATTVAAEAAPVTPAAVSAQSAAVEVPAAPAPVTVEATPEPARVQEVAVEAVPEPARVQSVDMEGETVVAAPQAEAAGSGKPFSLSDWVKTNTQGGTAATTSAAQQQAPAAQQTATAAAQTPFTSVATASAAQQPKKETAFDYQNDKLYQAFQTPPAGRLDEVAREGKPLYYIPEPTPVPLSQELEKMLRKKAELTLDGRWASSLRHSSDCTELFLLNVDAASSHVGIAGTCDLGRWMEQHGEWAFTTKERHVSATSGLLMGLELTRDGSLTYADVQEMLATAVEPYLGRLEAARPAVVSQISRGAIRSARLALTLSVKPAVDVLYGTLHVSVSVDTDSLTFALLDCSQPLLMAKTPADYHGFSAQTRKYVAASDTYDFTALQGVSVKDANELNNLGYLLLNGIGTEISTAKALQYFRQAAERGSKEAWMNLFLMYFHGIGSAPDRFQAFSCLARARDLNIAEAFEETEKWLRLAPNPDAAAADYFRTRIAQAKRLRPNQADKIYREAFANLYGKDGVQQNVSKAYRLAEEAAAVQYTPTGRLKKPASVEAAELLAEMYFSGVGTWPDWDEAIERVAQRKEITQNTLIGFYHE